MSERNLVALGVGAIGFLVGGPTGFAFGFTLGGLIGGLLFPEKIKGPRVKDLDVQISTYGEVIPLAWGWVRMAGNIIWASDIIEKKKEKSEFLGPTMVTYKYYGNFAVAFCEGEVMRWARVWADNKLIIERDEFGKTTGKGKKYAEYFYGDEEQEISPLQEEFSGVGNVPAYRGTAYIEFNMMKLADYGNRLPTINAEFFAGVSYQEPAGGWTPIDAAGQAPVGTTKDWFVTRTRSGTVTTLYGYSLPDGILRWTSSVPNTNVFSPAHLTKKDIVVVLSADYLVLYTVDCDDDGDVKGPFPMLPAGFFPGIGLKAFQALTSYPTDGGYEVNAQWGGGSSKFVLSGDGSMFLSGYSSDSSWMSFMVRGEEYMYGVVNFFASSERPLAVNYGGVGAFYTVNPLIACPDPYSIFYDESEDCVAVLASDNAVWVYNADLTKLIKRRPLGYAIPPNRNAYVSWYHGWSDGTIVIKEWRFDIEGFTNNIFHEYSLPYVREQWSINAKEETLWDKRDYYFETFGVVPAHNAILVHDGTYTRLWFLPPREYKMTLKQIVKDINIRAGLIEDVDFDISQLDDREVVGYYVNKEASARTMLEPLMAVYFFEGIETDGKIIYQHKNRLPVLTVDQKYLGTSDQGRPSPLLIEGRTQELDMPAEITVKYPSKKLDYNQNGQKARRAYETQWAEQRTSLDVPITMTDSDAKKTAEVMLLDAWYGRTSYEFSLPRKFIHLNPGDAITLAHDDREDVVYIESLDHGANGLLNLKARSHNPAAYTGIGLPPEEPEYPPTDPDVLGRARAQFIDGPLLMEGMDIYAVFYSAGEGDGNWPGGDIYKSIDNETFIEVTSMVEEAVIGFAASTMPNAANHCAIDYDSRVTVILGTGSLATTTLTDMLANSRNLAMLGNELIQFQRATLVDAEERIYELSWFVRGCRGTEWAMSSHVEGERFILLDGAAYVPVPVAPDDIGSLRYWKSVTFGLQEDETSSVTFTPQINQWKPLAPAHLFASKSGSDWNISWVRRARKSFEWRDTDVPLDETAEKYEVDVMSGSTVKRTIYVDGATSCTYTSAQQIADFGSVRTSITINVYQISARAGRGYVRNGTF